MAGEIVIKNAEAAGGFVQVDFSTKNISEIETTTQLNARDVANRNRVNHTGTQLASTVSDFNEAAQDAVGGILSNEFTYDDVTPDISVNAIDNSKITGLGALALKSTIGTSDIDNDAVTFAKIENIAASHLIGRSAAGNGDASALSATQVRSILNVENGAEANNISDTNATDLTDGGDSSLHFHSTDRDRANHTGTQLAATISDFQTQVSANSDVAANTAKVGITTEQADAIVANTAKVGVTNEVKSDVTGITGSDQITNMVSLTQSEYDAIVTKNTSTLYVITL